MVDIFIMKLEQIQPSQLYINSEKLTNALKDYDRLKPDLLEPFPVKKLGDDVILTDRHTIALVACLRGISEVRVYWEDEDLDEEAYQICVEWCKKEGVHSVTHLKDRIVSPEQFDLLWVERCKKMVQDLEAKRIDVSISSACTEDQELVEST